MSSAPPPSNPPNNNNEKDGEPSASAAPAPAEAPMDTTPDQPAEETWDDIPEDVMELGTDDIMTRTRLIDNDIKVRLLSPTSCAWSRRISVCLGYAVRNAASPTRAERNEGEDSRQWREGQAEQGSSLSCWKRR